MRCASCDREIPDEGMVCAFCNEPAPEPPPGYRELRREVRTLRGWLILSLAFGIVAAPFAIWRATRSLARFGGEAAAEDPPSYRQLVVMRRLAIALLALWTLLLAGHFGLSWTAPGGPEERHAAVLDAVVTDVLIECACPADTIYLDSLGHPLDSEVFEAIARGRNLRPASQWSGIHGGSRITVGTPHFFGEERASVAVQLHTSRPEKSFGAEYMLRREPDGRWKPYHRQIAWKS